MIPKTLARKEVNCVCVCVHTRVHTHISRTRGGQMTKIITFWSTSPRRWITAQMLDNVKNMCRSFSVYWHLNNIKFSNQYTQDVFEYVKILKPRQNRWFIQDQTNTYGKISIGTWLSSLSQGSNLSSLSQGGLG